MELTAIDWTVLAGAACLIGFAKTGVGGVAGVAVAAFAMVLPAKESTAALLLLLIVGDVLAVALYRRHADWRLLVRLLPAVLPGLVLGTWFVHVADQAVLRRSIAVILLVMAALQLWSSRRRRLADPQPADPEPADPQPADPEPAEPPARSRRVVPVAVGVVAGFATMTANAAGPVMSLYLLLSGRTVLQLLGTNAWYFLLVNLTKVPFSAGLGLFSAQSLLMDLLLVPAVLAGAAVGSRVAHRISLRVFGDLTLATTILAAVLLLL